MPHEFFRGMGMQFEAVSLTYVPWTPFYHTGYPPAPTSHDWIP
jgi:hypothetical protein